MLLQEKIGRLTLLVIMAISIGLFVVGGKPTSANTEYKQKTQHWVWPVVGEISDTFGTRHGRHKGLDIAAPKGEDTLTVDEGVVKKSYYSTTYGHVVFIGHPNGLETVYAHLSKRNVEEGDKVKAGQKIGEVGSTGVSTGSHLHFEVHKGEWTYDKNNAIDPLTVLNERKLFVAIDQEENEMKRQSMKLAASEFIEGYQNWETIHEEGKIAGQSIVVSKQSQNEEEIEPKVIEVQKNQTLWDISKENKVSIAAIMQWNDLKTDLLKVGQKIKIYEQHDDIYVVKKGDSLEQISKQVNISVEEIKALNDIVGDLIFPMQELIISK
ncbi:peptidoglycan DD-metalloendopeptidase family protein [Bacillus sp. PS06]|uniref:peptidoglycan DD-metalloendopeptidase family protein n=1 Tax=Bacillus sp. PS06 TaxID=2764176 RepID=UPI00178104D2|nr:peptidoglycan DD-metalloendopeptidase family protein [Bacillus sp. PS06]MBD8070292.1 peptidoglycan DD-metalloendopeptidase family protein [Bacillus sp. PS06]